MRVKALHSPGHIRTPAYLRGREGRLVAHLLDLPDAEAMAYGRREPVVAHWRVRFVMADLWPGYDGDPTDTLTADLAQGWLEPIAEAA